MRLYSGQIPLIASAVVRALREKQLVDMADTGIDEAELDVQGVLKEYSRTERDIARRAREIAGTDGHGAEAEAKRRLARERRFALGDDGVEYVVNQIIETFIESPHVEEIYGSDRDLRALLTPIIRKMTADRTEELDAEVRARMKNLREGSESWNEKYRELLAEVKRRKGLE